MITNVAYFDLKLREGDCASARKGIIRVYLASSFCARAAPEAPPTTQHRRAAKETASKSTKVLARAAMSGILLLLLLVLRPPLPPRIIPRPTFFC